MFLCIYSSVLYKFFSAVSTWLLAPLLRPPILRSRVRGSRAGKPENQIYHGFTNPRRAPGSAPGEGRCPQGAAAALREPPLPSAPGAAAASPPAPSRRRRGRPGTGEARRLSRQRRAQGTSPPGCAGAQVSDGCRVVLKMPSEKQTAVKYYVGVDVGSASVRAALVDGFGTVVAHAEQPIQVWEPQPDHYEQSSADIWAACCCVTKEVVRGVDASQIRGLGFDATCSLVVVDKHFQPLAVNSEGQNQRNVIMWMDHRAVSQVKRINATQHRVLSYVGGAMSVEMQPPKLLWIKEVFGITYNNVKILCCGDVAVKQPKAIRERDEERAPHKYLWKAERWGVPLQNLPESWEKVGYFFDLPDFLSWKATGVTARSLCTVVCKWTYTSDRGWDDSFWKMIGLEDLVKDKYEKIGVIGADVKGHNLPCENQPITSRVAMICGTSSCHMGVSETPIFVPGVWGPYFSAMIPGLWLNEGGQSATGKLIDHVVRGHVAFPELEAKAEASAHSIYTYLNSHLDLIKKSLPVGFLTVDLHVWPDFHGNRSPLTDLTLKGMVVGLTLSRGLDELALIYLATIQAIALGTRHILEAMQAAGHEITTLFLCGGLSKNPLFVQMHADITGKPVVLSKEVESVLVGAAILGACASGDFASIQEAMAKMGKIGKVVQPNHEHKRFYDKKYEVFLKLVEHQREYRSIMNSL
ncbi:FGGY carbohydrate kinase domain-containing protein isoform X6 [Passer montanus]|uniref:FGGY carbohydrate kinase domain-containing protein isoform X6 n=1 Tax=Passer montanus TaxID=9160 RepID=UPI001961556C|nr:FGGY carbohydrate kinase domain-containing protein isoform X6 [Passer montanus]